MATITTTTINPGTLGADMYNPAYLEAARLSGAKVMFRYTKNATKAEIDACHAKGVAWVPIIEGSSSDPLQGWAMGVQRATEGCAALRSLGYPKGCPVVIAIDTNPVDLAGCEAYFRGAAQVVALNGFSPWMYGGSRMWWRVRDVAQGVVRAAAGSWSPASIVWSPDVVQGVQEPQHRWDWDVVKKAFPAWLVRTIPDSQFPGLYPLNPSKPVLRVGSTDKATGGSVSYLQWSLRKAGYNIVQDGQFGPQTKGAVVGFQRARRLVADGVVGPQTWPAVDKVAVA